VSMFTWCMLFANCQSLHFFNQMTDLSWDRFSHFLEKLIHVFWFLNSRHSYVNFIWTDDGKLQLFKDWMKYITVITFLTIHFSVR
jgi:hypothetical protein